MAEVSRDFAFYLLLCVTALLRLLVPFRPPSLWKVFCWHMGLTVALFSGLFTHTTNSWVAGTIAALIICPFTWQVWDFAFELLGWKRTGRRAR